MTKNRLALGLSFLIALLMWIPQKLTKSYRHKIALKISATPPQDRQISGQKIVSLPIEISGKGNKLSRLTSDIKTDTLLIPVFSKAMSTQISASEIITQAREKYHIPEEISIRPDVSFIRFSFDSVTTKILPVIADYSLIYKSGFNKIGLVTITPEDITVVGPHELLNDMTYLSTEDLYITEIDESIEAVIPLQIPEFKDEVVYSHRQVTFQLGVDELTEKEVMVELEGFDNDGQTWQLFPDKVLVRLGIPLNRHANFNRSNIKLKLSALGDQAVSVEVDSLPVDAVYISHSPKILRYFVQRNDSL